MCGIFGFAGSPDRQLLGRMAAALVHRGPDDAGSFERAAVSLGHRRLSIIDRAGSHQPIANEDESIWLVYNGEIYNYRELRAELEAAGPRLPHERRQRSHRPCLRGVGAGLRGALQRHVGVRRSPTCARATASSSSIATTSASSRCTTRARRAPAVCCSPARSRACCRIRDLEATPDDQMVYEFLQHGLHDHRDETMFAGVYHVPAATWIEVPLAAAGEAAAPAASGDGATPGPLDGAARGDEVLDPAADQRRRPGPGRLPAPLPHQRRAPPASPRSPWAPASPAVSTPRPSSPS